MSSAKCPKFFTPSITWSSISSISSSFYLNKSRSLFSFSFKSRSSSFCSSRISWKPSNSFFRKTPPAVAREPDCMIPCLLSSSEAEEFISYFYFFISSFCSLYICVSIRKFSCNLAILSYFVCRSDSLYFFLLWSTLDFRALIWFSRALFALNIFCLSSNRISNLLTKAPVWLTDSIDMFCTILFDILSSSHYQISVFVKLRSDVLKVFLKFIKYLIGVYHSLITCYNLTYLDDSSQQSILYPCAVIFCSNLRSLCILVSNLWFAPSLTFCM